MTDGDAAAPEQSTDAGLQCHFCKKAQHDVELLVAGPSELICDECIDLCAEILMEHRGFQPCPHTVRSHPEYRAMFDNLTSTQERCGELLQDARTLNHALGAACDEMAIGRDGNYGNRDAIRAALMDQARRHLAR